MIQVWWALSRIISTESEFTAVNSSVNYAGCTYTVLQGDPNEVADKVILIGSLEHLFIVYSQVYFVWWIQYGWDMDN